MASGSITRTYTCSSIYDKNGSYILMWTEKEPNPIQATQTYNVSVLHSNGLQGGRSTRVRVSVLRFQRLNKVVSTVTMLYSDWCFCIIAEKSMGFSEELDSGRHVCLCFSVHILSLFHEQTVLRLLKQCKTSLCMNDMTWPKHSQGTHKHILYTKNLSHIISQQGNPTP